MQDKHGRDINYMRISITDRCNLRCRYCMPEGVEWIPMEQILTYEDILFLCRQAAALGISRYKVTGGEPLVRRGCADFIARMKGIPGVEQVTMTTNGVALKAHLPELKEAGLDAVNISLDTLNREMYQQITGADRLMQVTEAIDASLEQGFSVKINVVLQKGINDGEWLSLAQLAKDRPLSVRFIELMPIGHGSESAMVPNDWLLGQLKGRYPGICRNESVQGNGPAVYYLLPGFLGSVGFISALHGKFCDSCNRIRLTSTGMLKPCLCYADSISVREAVKERDAELAQKLLAQAIAKKPQMHCFEQAEQVTERHKMTQIGG